MNLEEILAKEASSRPYRTCVTPMQREEEQIKILATVLKDTIMKELLAKKV